METEITTLVPKQFCCSPLFAAIKQKEVREVMVFGQPWTIGGYHPLDKEKKLFSPAFDVRHGKLIFVLLSKFNFSNMASTVNFSMSDLCRQYYRRENIGKTEHDEIKSLLHALHTTPITIHEGEREYFFWIVRALNIAREKHRKKDMDEPELWLENIELEKLFVEKLLIISNVMRFRLETLLKIRNQTAQALYIYLPSRAYHRTKENPFEISLGKLLEELGFTARQKKSLRKRVFYYPKKGIDVFSELDGIAVLGGKLRVNLVETADGKDYKLCAWKEKNIFTIERSGKLYEAWKASGKTDEMWQKCLDQFPNIEFDEYEEHALSYIPDWDNAEKFLLMAKCLLGEMLFKDRLGDVKNYILEDKTVNDKPIEKPIAYLIDLILRSFKPIVNEKSVQTR